MNSVEPPHHKSLGKWMIIIAWMIVLGMLTLLFGNWEKKQYNPNTTPESQITQLGTYEVKLIRNRYGSYITTGYINNKKVEFLIDTGASNVAIPGKIANELGLTKGMSYSAMTAGGVTTAYATTIAKLRIGDIVLTNVEASIIPAMDDLDILLGMSVLKQIEFTQRGNELILRQTVQ